jgi:hypothetical protein
MAHVGGVGRGIPKRFRDLFKSGQTPGLGARSVSACRNWAFPRKSPPNVGLIWGGRKKAAWVSGSRRPLQGRNCSHPNGLITPEQASALVEKGKTLRE